MDWLKRLQEKYKAGKLTKAQYDAKVKELLEDGDLTQEDHDKALEFDPKAPEGGELIYSQEDMDRMAVNVARRLIRKEFKAAGIDLDVDNKGLLAHVVSLAKGTEGSKDGKGAAGLTEEQVKALQKKAERADALTGKLKDLSLEVAVMKNAAKYNPVNPAAVVRALRDYADDIEYDENDVPDSKSVDLALKKIAKEEPYLFTPKTDEGQNPEGSDKGGGSTFSGRSPGGAAGSGTEQKSKEDALVAESLRAMGLNPDKK